MAFQGGPISTVGITPAFITQLATQTASSGVPQILGQVFQGAGQSFYGQAGQALGGALAGSAINIALNSTLGTQVVGPQGLSLTSGANLLASTITPYVTGSLAAGINQSIQQSLESAGAFGPILANFGTQFVNQAFNGATDLISGGASQGSIFKMFPGAGDEPPADYGGSSYTLDDVVFSIQPANQGPQAFGLNQALNTPTSVTTLPLTQLTTMPLSAGSPTVNAAKQLSMGVSNTSTSDLVLSGTTTGTNFSSLNYGIR